MKKGLILLVIIGGFFNSLYSAELDSIKIQKKLDEIVLEADILFRFEKAARLSVDIAMSNSEVKQTYKDYLVYSTGDSLKAIIINNNNKCSYELTFLDDFDKPINEINKVRELTLLESKYLLVKSKMIKQVSEPKYKVGCPEGFELNFILLPDGKKYKLYILTGTSQSNIIPFGNDYLFEANEKGKIKKWRKFHSRLIPMQTVMKNGMKMISTAHSHLKSEPYITATDICTFRLYGELCGQKEFRVYSTALKLTFKYNLIENSIIIED
jgi:hypothetical protein